MRFLKNLNANSKAPADQRFLITPSSEVQFNTSRSLQLPSGGVSGKAQSPTAGMIRYNSDPYNASTNPNGGQVEVYQGSNWRALRYKESGAITIQNLGNGDGVSTLYGPINPAFIPSVVQSGYTWTGANLMVYIENVFQIYNTNYLIATNPVTETTIATTANSGSSSLIVSNIGDIIIGSAITNTAPTVTVSTTVNTVSATATYVSGAVTNNTLVITGQSGTIVNGALVTGTGFNQGQYVVSGAGTSSLVLSAPANSTPSGTISFAASGYSPASTNLIVNSTTSIIAGYYVYGIGFDSGQTVVSVTNGNVLVLSAPPDSTPTGTLVFTNSVNSTVFAPGTTVTSVNTFTNTIGLSISTTGSLASGRAITFTLPSGSYVRFTGPASAAKPITVIAGFDS